MIYNSAVPELIQRARRIKANPKQRGTLSSGQMVEVALVLNRPTWLAEAGFSLSEAVARLSHAELDTVVLAARNLDSHAVTGGNRP